MLPFATHACVILTDGIMLIQDMPTVNVRHGLISYTILFVIDWSSHVLRQAAVGFSTAVRGQLRAASVL